MRSLIFKDVSKGLFFMLLTFISLQSFSQISKNITFLDQWFSDTIITYSSEARFNDCVGFTSGGKEYAVIGSTEGIHFFSTEKNKLIQKGYVQGTFSSAAVVHRDIKTYKNFAYTVCDEGPSALQIIDLNYLPDSVHLVAEISTGFGRVHNLFIDTVNALLYACSVTPIVNGNPTLLIPMRVFSLADPISPTLVYQGPTGIDAVHDCFVRDNIAYLNCGYDGIRVYDFSIPSAPVYIQNITFYQDQGYNHQGWLTPNGKRYFFGDETMGKRIKACDVAANHELQIMQKFGTNYQGNSVAHNMMASDEFLFVAYYNEGLRIFDIRNNPEEIAFYDTYPKDYFYKLNGAWGIYSELPSGRIIVSDRQSGLFLLDFDRSAFKPQSTNVFVYPTILAGGEEVTIQLKSELATNFEVEIYDLGGKCVTKKAYHDQTSGRIEMPKEIGVYYLKIKYLDYLNDEILEIKKVVVGN